jgi:hypothetical protein
MVGRGDRHLDRSDREAVTDVMAGPLESPPQVDSQIGQYETVRAGNGRQGAVNVDEPTQQRRIPGQSAGESRRNRRPRAARIAHPTGPGLIASA